MSGATPHADSLLSAVPCAVLTISDTRTRETDKSGRLICAHLVAEGHRVEDYQIVPDEPDQIVAVLKSYQCQGSIAAAILSGGTGISHRDTTYDAVSGLLDKTLPGFGEVFRALSYQEIGSRAIASRAIAGTYRSLLIFSLPGSSKAAQLAMSDLILPELRHLTSLLKSSPTGHH